MNFFKNPLVSSTQFNLLAVFVTCVFLTGGATRFDVQSLALLRPLSVVVCAVALLTLHRRHMIGRQSLTVGCVSIFALAISHLIPLPPGIWEAMSGRQELAEIDKLAGIDGTWRPLTVTPINGVHALLSLFAPLAVILMGVQLDRKGLYRLLPLLIALGVLSGIIGLAQTVGGIDSPLYLYNITNKGIAVGLFANRNHGAVMLACLLPMLAVYGSKLSDQTFWARYRKILISGIVVTIVPLILISGSRSGAVVAIVGLVGAALLYKSSSKEQKQAQRKTNLLDVAFPSLLALAIFSSALLTYFFSRAETISRLFRPTDAEAGRLEYWAASLNAFWKYFPWGSGSGSFAEAYQSVEPDNLLSTNYLNRAHNDWLETGVTFGLAGLVFMSVVLIFFALRSYKVWCQLEKDRRSTQFARLGCINLIILALASITDYPLRTPIMMCCAAIYFLWFTWPNDNLPSPSHRRTVPK